MSVMLYIITFISVWGIVGRLVLAFVVGDGDEEYQECPYE